LKLFSVSVRRPPRKDNKGEEIYERWREAFVMSSGYDEAVRKAVAYYNDLDDVDDYFTNGVSVCATTADDDDAAQGGVLLM
jgi:hypothetical protein